MAFRPYWSGNIKLSLVSLPVEIYPALNRSRQIPFHEIYKPTGQRIRHVKMADDEPVDAEDIVKGYEVEKGEYIIIDAQEIKNLKIPSKETLDIVEFVAMDAIDDVYLETPYFVVPKGKGGDSAFAIIRDALRESSKIGLGQLAIGGRERLCAVKPHGSGLLLETLRYEDEIRDSDPYFENIGNDKNDREELALAKELIKRKTSTFKPDKFHDHYREALQELIDAKLERRSPKIMTSEKPSGKVVNLMDALRRSLTTESGKPQTAKKPAPRKPKAKPATVRKKKAS